MRGRRVQICRGRRASEVCQLVHCTLQGVRRRVIERAGERAGERTGDRTIDRTGERTVDRTVDRAGNLTH